MWVAYVVLSLLWLAAVIALGFFTWKCEDKYKSTRLSWTLLLCPLISAIALFFGGVLSRGTAKELMSDGRYTVMTCDLAPNSRITGTSIGKHLCLLRPENSDAVIYYHFSPEMVKRDDPSRNYVFAPNTELEVYTYKGETYVRALPNAREQAAPTRAANRGCGKD